MQKKLFTGKKTLLLVVAATMLSSLLYAQKKAEPLQPATDTAHIIPFDFNRDIQEQLPALDSLIALAHLNSPTLSKYHNYALAEKEKLRLEKNSWLHNVQLNGNYSMGNQNLVLSGSSAADISQLSNGFRFGVNVGMPIFEFVTRGSRVNVAKAGVRASEDQWKEAAMQLDQAVISVYMQLIASFRQWKSTQTLIEKSSISEMLAEKKLKQNEISLADYSRVAEVKAQADNRKFESEKVLFDAYYTLQTLIGVPLITLKQ